ncbi:MAG: MarR family transcriptional regulator [Cyclobacteriaceae bacterium]|nr:MarR family transcriptional regulator [Cyclobacteriaceae bacterium]
MKSVEIEKELEEHRLTRHRNWAKLVNKLKKQWDIRLDEILSQHGYTDFKPGYMPFLMNIDPEGITNNDLSKKFAVSKQATSKILNELIELRYITEEPHGEDGRSTIIYLTDNGKKFVIEAKHCMQIVHAEYRKLLGKKEYDNMIDNIIKIIDYNEQRTGPASC